MVTPHKVADGKCPRSNSSISPSASHHAKSGQQPNYVCIDKACLLLCTAVQHGAWDVWGQTTHFIVDSYHYINHCTTD
ncbi:hypothetical protein BDQ12DRAFT_616898 [Crucibulum laeve]|uniref:Uncharacterized protein n=1 Tax=Crucibulum laeve TaxID=68775 RepID=A0A5C3LIM2_9AGAR|nr:hypothetical protein BDQ12DRAFT_616898 [Crucibulum laeve]